MKHLLLWFAAVSSLFAFADSLRSFSADFTQEITDDTNKTITYRGHVDAQRPDKALWEYSSPVHKSVYIVGHNVTIIEPELEQAIVKTIREEIDLLKILSKAEKIDDNTYLAAHGSQHFRIRTEADVPAEIRYKDTFENRISIRFSNTNVNSELNQTLFKPVIPDDYDILSE